MNYRIEELNVNKYSDLLFDIVKLEDIVFGEASIGNWNIKPMTKYGKVFAILSDNDEIYSVIEVMPTFDRELAYIYGVFVSPDHQGNGYSRILLNYVLNELKNINIKRVELTTDKDNYKAYSLYTSIGFKIVKELENEYGNNKIVYMLRIEI